VFSLTVADIEKFSVIYCNNKIIVSAEYLVDGDKNSESFGADTKM